MPNDSSWTISPYNDGTKIKSILQAIVESSPSTAANNRWEYLYPLLDLFYDNADVFFAVQYRGEQVTCAIPIVLSRQKKFFYRWNEIGFPFHNHINLITLAPSQNELNISELITKINSLGLNWERFSIRNIFTKSINNMEYSGDVALFDTSHNAPIENITSKKHIKNVRRLERRLLSECGSIDFEFKHPCLTSALSEFSELESSSWKGADGVAISSNKKIETMYQEFSNNFNDENMKIYHIRTDQCLLASALGFKLGGTLYIHKITFNEKYSHAAPGNILLLKILEHALSTTDISIVNLVTYPKWAERWHPQKLVLGNIVHYNRTIKGQVLKYCITLWRKTKPSLKKLFIK
ncbi:MAG: GNAT family N-acetyltransferase [Colwellia sp.]